jgi:hypothetical protein
LRALVLSPSASHPQDYGNRNRVWQITSFLKQSGYAVDFLLYPFEAEWSEGIPAEAEDMRRAWDAFWIVPPSIPLHARAKGDYHQIDEWWDEAIGRFLSWLFARRTYDLFVVNYTFLSKAFTFAPKNTIRVLDTHDLFSGRKEMLAALGVPPEFFYTTPEQEKIAFDRADIVVAIKDSEADRIEAIAETEVVSLPFFPAYGKADGKGSRAKRRRFAGLSIGFIGAFNQVNIANFQRFLNEFDRIVRIYCPPLRLLVAGNVCRGLHSTNPAFELLGKVEDIGAFYAEVDIVAAPMMFSTGIKIKVGEALHYGKGVVSTVNGFDGFPATDPMHALSSVAEVCRALIVLAFDRHRCRELVARSRLAGELAQQSTALAFVSLAESIRSRARRSVFIVDEPYWRDGGFRAARLAQWAQLCGFLTPVVACHLRTGESTAASLVPDPNGAAVEIDIAEVAEPAQIAALADRLDDCLRRIGRIQPMLSIDKPWAGALWLELLRRGHAPIVDLWCPALAEAASRAGVCPGPDLWIAAEGDGERLDSGVGVETMPIRYVPSGLAGLPDRPVERRVVAILGSDDGEAKYTADELDLALRAHGVPLEYIASGVREDPIEMVYTRLRQGGRPMLLVAVAAPPSLRLTCLALSLLGGIPFLDLDHKALPWAMPDADGNPRLFHSCFDLVGDLVAQHEAGTGPAPVHNASDAGWSRLWQTLESRLWSQRPKTASA